MKKRIRPEGVRAIALIMCLLMVLAACGGDVGSDTTSASGDTGPDTTSASGDTGPDTTSATGDTTTIAAVDSTDATTEESTETTADEASKGDVFGSPETDTIRVVNASTSAGSNAVFTIGIEDGTFAEEGIEVEVALTNDPLPPVVGGSADIAVIEAPYFTESAAEGVDLVIVSGFRCREQYAFATQPDVTAVEDLAGKDVNLDGSTESPVVQYRMKLLKEAGWDLSSVPDVNYVRIQGDSSAWFELFQQGQIALTPFYRSQTTSYQELGANIVLNQFIEWPNEILAARREWVEQNPNALGRFLRGIMKTSEYYMDPAHKEEVIEMSVAQGYGTERIEADYMSGPILHCPNKYVNAEVVEMQLEAQPVEGAPSFDEMAILEPLLKAQESLGLDNEPTTPPSPDAGLPGSES